MKPYPENSYPSSKNYSVAEHRKRLKEETAKRGLPTIIKVETPWTKITDSIIKELSKR